MELALQTISIDKTISSIRILNKKINSHSLAQHKLNERLVSMVTSITKSIDLLAIEILEFSTENEALKGRIREYDKETL